jgi:hypothetical protein
MPIKPAGTMAVNGSCSVMFLASALPRVLASCLPVAPDGTLCFCILVLHWPWVPRSEGAADGPLEQLQRSLRQADRDLSRGLRGASQSLADGLQTLSAPPQSPVRGPTCHKCVCGRPADAVRAAADAGAWPGMPSLCPQDDDATGAGRRCWPNAQQMCLRGRHATARHTPGGSCHV